MISVIIPTLNEGSELPTTLGRLLQVPEVEEIIVSDGGSIDGTVAVARDFGCRAVKGGRGRGSQLRMGAEIASKSVIAMVHADTWVEPNFGSAILATLRRPHHVGGACLKTFRDPHWLMRGSRLRCRLRMRLWQFAYGDQVLFFPREVLSQIGGIPDVPLMEEYLLCQAARRLGRLGLAETTVTTSARRFRQRGVFRTYWRMAMVNWKWNWGASPEELRRYYERR